MQDTDENSRLFRLHFEGHMTSGHSLPAAALVQALDHFQRMVHLLAMAEEGKEVHIRARITKEIEQRYPLVCRIPEEGGFAQPLHIGGQATTELFDSQKVTSVAEKVFTTIEAINNGNKEKLLQAIPDQFYRRSILSELSKMLPPVHSGIVLSIEDYKKKKVLDGFTAQEKLKELLTPQIEEEPSAGLGYVAGTLIEMKFNERRLNLQLLNSNKSLSATYNDDFEPILLDHPRELIQVHGNVTYNEDNNPVSISDVDAILEIDDSLIEITSVKLKGSELRPKTALRSKVSFDRETELYQAEGPFDILTNAVSRPDLEEMLHEELALLWLEFVKTDAQGLTAQAQTLRDQLLNAFDEVPDAN